MEETALRRVEEDDRKKTKYNFKHKKAARWSMVEVGVNAESEVDLAISQNADGGMSRRTARHSRRKVRVCFFSTSKSSRLLGNHNTPNGNLEAEKQSSTIARYRGSRDTHT